MGASNSDKTVRSAVLKNVKPKMNFKIIVLKFNLIYNVSVEFHFSLFTHSKAFTVKYENSLIAGYQPGTDRSL